MSDIAGPRSQQLVHFLEGEGDLPALREGPAPELIRFHDGGQIGTVDVAQGSCKVRGDEAGAHESNAAPGTGRLQRGRRTRGHLPWLSHAPRQRRL